MAYTGTTPFAHTFGEVAEGKPLGYMNSLMNFSVALNMGSLRIRSTFVGAGP